MSVIQRQRRKQRTPPRRRRAGAWGTSEAQARCSAAVVLLLATARAARVATPTKDDRIRAHADAAGTQRIFTEQCRRDRSQETCDTTGRAGDMRARDLVRRRSSEEPVVMAPS